MLCVGFVGPVQAGGVKAESRCQLPEVKKPASCQAAQQSVFLKALWKLIEEYEATILTDDTYPGLYAAVERYWAARSSKRLDVIEKLLPTTDDQQRSRRLESQQEILAEEDVVAYRICALQTFERESTIQHLVFVRVLAVIDGRCFDDVVAMGWVSTDGEWQLEPSEPDRWRPLAEPIGP